MRSTRKPGKSRWQLGAVMALVCVGALVAYATDTGTDGFNITPNGTNYKAIGDPVSYTGTCTCEGTHDTHFDETGSTCWGMTGVAETGGGNSTDVYLSGTAATVGTYTITGGCKKPTGHGGSDSETLVIVNVTLAVENNLTQCMEGRHVTYTATASSNFPHGLTNPITFVFHYQRADGTLWTSTDYSADLAEDNTAVADNVLAGDTDHKFTTPIYATVSNDGASATSNTLNIDVYELWIDYFKDNATGTAWKVCVNKAIAFGAIASSDCTSWAWDMADGVPDQWNPTGGNAKSGTGMVIPTTDLPSGNSAFGDAYGTVDVFCEDGEGNNHHFYSTSMSPSQKAQVFFERDACQKTSDPNWYYYWASDKGGPCTHKVSGSITSSGADVYFDFSSTQTQRGMTAPNDDYSDFVTVLSPATVGAWSDSFTSPRVPSTGTFNNSVGNPTSFDAGNITISISAKESWEAIDIVEHVINHELQHVKVRRWWLSGGTWYNAYGGARDTGAGGNDQDNDWLPSAFEDSFGTRFDSGRTFPYPPDTGCFYLSGTDEEVYAESLAAMPNLSGTTDWAYPGKQWH